MVVDVEETVLHNVLYIFIHILIRSNQEFGSKYNHSQPLY